MHWTGFCPECQTTKKLIFSKPEIGPDGDITIYGECGCGVKWRDNYYIDSRDLWDDEHETFF